MGRVIRMDIKRILYSRRTLKMLLLECFLAAGYFLLVFPETRMSLEDTFPKTLIQYYIGADVYTFFGDLYKTFFPVLVSVPFATAFYEDGNSGYINQIVTRIPRMKFLTGRWISTFVSGFASAVFVLCASLLLQSSVVPAVNPSTLSNLTAVHEGAFLSSLYFTHSGM